MSRYENYNATSLNYDETRAAVGIDVLLGIFGSGACPLADQVILDGACGTGNYIAGIRGHVARVHGIDLNPGMLSQTRAKLGDEHDVDLTRTSLMTLPFADASFDGMMVNQAVHHLDVREAGHSFPHLRQFVNEAARVLRPGGSLSINTCSQSQLRDGYWFMEIFDAGYQRMKLGFCTPEQIDEMFLDAGLEPKGHVVPLNALLMSRDYLDPEGPLREAWRSGDSTFSLLTDAELEASLERLRAMNADGSIHAYLEQREALRRDLGQSVFVYATKPA